MGWCKVFNRFTIYVDSREQKPYSFQNYPVQTESVTLKTGDYCVAEDGNAMGDNGFEPNYAVERKNPDDFLQSITWERDRFEDELARADRFAHRMPVIVERGYEYFKEEQYYRDVGVNSITATVDTHPQMFNVDYYFENGRTQAEKLCFEFLNWRKQMLDRRTGTS